MLDGPAAQHARDHRHATLEKLTTWYSLLGQIVAWSVAAVLFALILVLVVIPRVTGSTPYTILTSSMVPLMPPGTIVVDRPEPFSDIKVGDVLTYQIASGQPAVVTHRVVGINVEQDGSQTLTMKGDANPSPDVRHIISKQVRGVVWYSIPLIGYVGAVGTADGRSVIARIIGGGLLVYAACVLIVALVRRRKRGTREQVNPERVTADAMTTRSDPQ
jgi:signal peptidase I